jgi:hypothetical protein
MNERIRQLYEQARLHAKSIDADIDPKGWMDLYHKKFAELIVRECMDVAYDNTPNSEECEYKRLVHDKIKEHFGVER